MRKSSVWTKQVMALLAVGMMAWWGEGVALAETEMVDGVEWSYAVSNGTATVTGAEPAVGDLTIPDELGGCPVTRIGNQAFYGCTNLTELTLPDCVTKIGKQAFTGSGLTALSVPMSLRFLSPTLGVPEGCEVEYRTIVPESVSVPGSIYADTNLWWDPSTNLLSTHDGFDWFGSITPGASSGQFKFAANKSWDVNWGGEFSVLRVPAYNVGPLVQNGANISWQNATVDAAHTFVFHEDTATFDIVPVSAPPRTFSSVQLVGNFNEHRATSEGALTCSGSLWTGEIEVPDGADSFLLRVDKQDLWGIAAPSAVVLPVTDVSLCGASALSVSGIQYGTLDVAFDSTKLLLTIFQKSIHDLWTESLDGVKWIYSVTNGTAILRGVDPAEGELAIPAEVGGYAVTAIGKYAFHGCSRVTSLTIPASVTNIMGPCAFAGCTGLKWLSVPAEWAGTSILANSSASCWVLYGASPEMVDGVEWFYSVSNGVAIVLGAEPAEGALAIPSTLGGYPVGAIGPEAFYACRNLTSVTIPDSVTSIDHAAFYYCDGLTNVLIGEGVTSIGDEAFWKCVSLTSVTIPDSVTNIERAAFYYCDGLTNVLIGEGVTGIGDEAFRACYRLTSVTIPGSVTDIGDVAFEGCRGLTSVAIPNSVTNIGYLAFDGCSELQWISVPEALVDRGFWGQPSECLVLYGTLPVMVDGVEWFYNVEDGAAIVLRAIPAEGELSIPSELGGYAVTGIASGAFQSCSGLTGVTIPDNVTNILRETFCGCWRMTNVVIGEGVRSIGSEAFAGCSNLTSVTIGENVESIDDRAFEDCVRLTSVTIPASVTYVGFGPFDWCLSLQRVNVPAEWSGTWEGQRRVENVMRGTPSTCRVMYGQWTEPLDGVKWFHFVTNGTTIVMGVEPTGGELAIPSVLDGYLVMAIGPRAFAEYHDFLAMAIPDTVTHITIPDSVTNIYDSAFAGCINLTNVTIPDSVTSIGSYAFSDCIGLYDTNTLQGVCLVDGWAVGWTNSCPEALDLKGIRGIAGSAFFRCRGLTSVTIPDGVTSIGNEVFYQCSGLTSLTIPNSVTSIGNEAFSGCSGLKELRVSKEWESKYVDVWGDTYFWSQWASVPSGCEIIYYEPGESGEAVAVPEEWMDTHAAEILSAHDGDYAAAAKAAAANGMPVWECYLAGLSPTNAAAEFKVKSIEFVDGQALVKWEPDLNEDGTKEERLYEVEGAESLEGAWGPTNAASRFFRVKVALP